MNPKVDFYFTKNLKWQKEIKQLRTIMLECGLNEELKWGVPCYTFQKSNIVLIHVFREYCAVLFFKGALLKDENGILVQQTKNVQAGRQVRFANLKEVVEKETILKNYVYEAIEIERAGLKVEFNKTPEIICKEFQKKLDKTPSLKKAFHALTPGRQRAYNLYFSSAKQSKTRELRIENNIENILCGKGLND